MNYKTLLEKLFLVNKTLSMKFGLKNSEALHAHFQFPAKRFQTIHIAGSNGKGSCCIKIAKALELSGLKVGLYTSPHISSFQERIQINGKLISKKDITCHLKEIFSVIEKKQLPATFFEITTMLALNYFREQKIDVAVLETGLGGRLDATNIVIPKLSVITSISLDHTDILGDTLEKIAFEKAGIIKPNVPVVVGPKALLSCILETALQKNSPCIEVKGNFLSFEEENNAIARVALQELKVEETFITAGLKAKQPCRLEVIEYKCKTIILDVAHNPDGLTRLFADIKSKWPLSSFQIICGLSQNKDIKSCTEILKKHGKIFHLVSAKNGRGLDVQQLKTYFSDTNDLFCHESLKEAINACLLRDAPILICGTFFIMAEARIALGKKEPVDEIDMNEAVYNKTACTG